MTKKENNLALFSGQEIRRFWDEKQEKWYFSIIDVIAALINSVNPKDYWYKMKIRVKSDDGFELSTICRQLKFLSRDGKKYLSDATDTEGIFRIIQSIPSPKAEPFKRWLAKVGYERIQEVEDPELATKRTRLLYKLKGYPEDWIEKRMRGIAIREELTDEWQKRGAQKNKDYEILTAEISQAAFGLNPNEYKKLKGLKKENLRDHMDDFELILTMLSEKTTAEIHRSNDSLGMVKLKDDARVGGSIAGSARKQIERKIGRPIVSGGNYKRNILNKI